MTIELEDFEKVDIRVGKVLSVEDFPEGKYSSHILRIDFGDQIGIKKSLARLYPKYSKEIEGTLVLAVINFKPRQIGKHLSEVLTLGVPDENGNIVLITPKEEDAVLGGKLY